MPPLLQSFLTQEVQKTLQKSYNVSVSDCIVTSNKKSSLKELTSELKQQSPGRRVHGVLMFTEDDQGDMQFWVTVVHFHATPFQMQQQQQHWSPASPDELARLMALVLHIDDKPTTVDEQCNTWDTLVNLSPLVGKSTGDMLAGLVSQLHAYGLYLSTFSAVLLAGKRRDVILMLKEGCEGTCEFEQAALEYGQPTETASYSYGPEFKASRSASGTCWTVDADDLPSSESRQLLALMPPAAEDEDPDASSRFEELSDGEEPAAGGGDDDAAMAVDATYSPVHSPRARNQPARKHKRLLADAVSELDSDVQRLNVEHLDGVSHKKRKKEDGSVATHDFAAHHEQQQQGYHQQQQQGYHHQYSLKRTLSSDGEEDLDSCAAAASAPELVPPVRRSAANSNAKHPTARRLRRKLAEEGPMSLPIST